MLTRKKLNLNPHTSKQQGDLPVPPSQKLMYTFFLEDRPGKT